MTVVFVSQPAFAPTMHRRAFVRSPCYGYERGSSCGSNFISFMLFALLFAPIFVPILKFGLLVLAIHGFLSCVACLINSVASVASDCCFESCGTKTHATAPTKPQACPCPPTTCPCTPSSSCGATACDGSKTTVPAKGTVREQLEKERRDLSSVRVATAAARSAAEEIKIVVAAPGVRFEDVRINVLDQILHIAGETIKGAARYAVDRRIQLPSAADVESASASYADGEVTITMKRKAGTRIEIVQAVREKDTAAAIAKPEASDEVQAQAASPSTNPTKDGPPPLRRKSNARPVVTFAEEPDQEAVEEEEEEEEGGELSAAAAEDDGASSDEWEALPKDGE